MSLGAAIDGLGGEKKETTSPGLARSTPSARKPQQVSLRRSVVSVKPGDERQRARAATRCLRWLSNLPSPAAVLAQTVDRAKVWPDRVLAALRVDHHTRRHGVACALARHLSGGALNLALFHNTCGMRFACDCEGEQVNNPTPKRRGFVPDAASSFVTVETFGGLTVARRKCSPPR